MRRLVLILLLIGTPANGPAQLELPAEITIFVNNEELDADTAFMDSLISEAQNFTIFYNIVAAHDYYRQTTVKIRLAQTLLKSEVIRQCILCFSLLDDEKEREQTELFVYPFFVSVKDTPAVVCKYKTPGIFIFQFNEWHTLPVTVTPSPEEIEIFNDILKQSLTSIQSLDSLPHEIFAEIAHKRHLKKDYIQKVYRKVMLWKFGHD